MPVPTKLFAAIHRQVSAPLLTRDIHITGITLMACRQLPFPIHPLSWKILPGYLIQKLMFLQWIRRMLAALALIRLLLLSILFLHSNWARIFFFAREIAQFLIPD